LKRGKLIIVRSKRERKASWNELFYDLVFVAAIGKKKKEETK